MAYGMVEIKLTNGKRVLLYRNWNKIYDVCETSYHKMSFTKHFPFVKIDTRKCTSFKVMTHYSTLDSFFDPRYYADCSILQLASLFGENVFPFEKTCIEGDLHG